MEPKQLNTDTVYTMLFSTKAIIGKLLITLSPAFYFMQEAGPPMIFWEKIANISIALFVLSVGIYIVYHEYKKTDNYAKDRNDKIIEMAERTAQLAESSTRATENSTEAIKNMTQSLERIFDKLDQID